MYNIDACHSRVYFKSIWRIYKVYIFFKTFFTIPPTTDIQVKAQNLLQKMPLKLHLFLALTSPAICFYNCEQDCERCQPHSKHYQLCPVKLHSTSRFLPLHKPKTLSTGIARDFMARQPCGNKHPVSFSIFLCRFTTVWYKICDTRPQYNSILFGMFCLFLTWNI